MILDHFKHGFLADMFCLSSVNLFVGVRWSDFLSVHRRIFIIH
jgi:hypothetical protein